jgi:hypothetical protein
VLVELLKDPRKKGVLVHVEKHIDLHNSYHDFYIFFVEEGFDQLKISLITHCSFRSRNSSSTYWRKSCSAWYINP